MQNIYRTYREGKIIKNVRGITTVNFIQISSLAAAVCKFFQSHKEFTFREAFCFGIERETAKLFRKFKLSLFNTYIEQPARTK